MPASLTVYKHDGAEIFRENKTPDPITLSLSKEFWFGMGGKVYDQFEYTGDVCKRLSLKFKLEKITKDEVHYISTATEDEDKYSYSEDDWQW